jgi:hypothetical protein
MYTEIINFKEYYTVKFCDCVMNRINFIIVNIAPSGKFVCINQEVDPDNRYIVVSEHNELCDTYKQVMTFVENAMYYNNGNEYIKTIQL